MDEYGQNTPAGNTSAGDGIAAKPVPHISVQAFCETPETASLIEGCASDRRMAKANVTVQMGGIPGAMAFFANAPTPNLIVVESMHQRDQMLMDLDRLATVCDAGTKIVVVGHVNDVILYRGLVQRGVNEYVVSPTHPLQIMESISNLFASDDSAPIGQVIAFIGAKGGAGSSTVCHNTAWALTKVMKSDVTIADFDLAFGTAGLDFNSDPVQGIADALASPERLDDVFLERLLEKTTDHLSLLTAPATLDKTYDLGKEVTDKVIDVVRQSIPYIAVDIPHTWTGWSRNVITQADQIVITATPDLASLRNAKNLIELLVDSRGNDAPPMLVLNQVGVPKRPEISVTDFANALDTDASMVLDFDAQLFGTATNNGQMIEELAKNSEPARKFRELAMRLTNSEIIKESGSKSMLSPLLDKLKFKKTG